MALWESTSRSIVVWHIVWGYCSLAQWHGSPVRATGTTPQPPPPPPTPVAPDLVKAMEKAPRGGVRAVSLMQKSWLMPANRHMKRPLMRLRERVLR